MTSLYMCQSLSNVPQNISKYCDGVWRDSKAYLSMKQSVVYHVTKEESINFVSKHMSN